MLKKEDICNGQQAPQSKPQECHTNSVNTIYMAVATHKFRLLFSIKITVQYIGAEAAALQKPITVSVTEQAGWSPENNARFLSDQFLKCKATIFQTNTATDKKSSSN